MGKPPRRSRAPRPGRRRTEGAARRTSLALWLGLTAVLLVAASSLAIAARGQFEARDWAQVASVDGTDIDRGHLRLRVATLSYLDGRRIAQIEEAAQGGMVSKAAAAALEQPIEGDLADIVTAARENLIDETLLRSLAAHEGVRTPSVADPSTAAAAYVGADIHHEVRWVRFGLPTQPQTPTSPAGPVTWPAADASHVATTSDQLAQALRAGTSIDDILKGMRAAGWEAAGVDEWLSASGVPAETRDDPVDPEIAAASLAASPGGLLGPVTDEHGRRTAGILVKAYPSDGLAGRLSAGSAEAGANDGDLRSWAEAQALRSALAHHMLATWTRSVDEVHLRAAIVGNAPAAGSAGPWVELSELDVNRVGGLDQGESPSLPSGIDPRGGQLPAALRGLSVADRVRVFGTLVAAANAGLPTDAPLRSGELGFRTKDSLVPDLGKAAFAPTVRTGDVLGPVNTPSGPRLYLVEARYVGSLDDRSGAALAEIRVAGPSADLASFTRRFSPTDVPLSLDAGWRAEPEAGPDDPARTLFETDRGVLTDPFLLDGKLAVGIVDARETKAPDKRVVARLALVGFDAWLATQISKATITRAAHPLPELEPSASPSASIPPIPLDTPQLPAIPGQPSSAPAKTDEFGLPALP